MKKRKSKSKSTKGALITGMTYKLPSDILADEMFKEKIKEMLKGFSGIYALYDKKKLYYVGLTKNLHGRINSHMRDRHSRRWDQFAIYRIKKVRFLKDIETLVQRIADCPGNKFKGKVPRDADLSRILQQIASARSKELKQLRRALKRSRQ